MTSAKKICYNFVQFISRRYKKMKNKILLSSLALALTTTLQAESFFSAPFDKHIQQFDEQMEQFMNDELFFSFPSKYHINIMAQYPKMDVFENENFYTFEFELAGVDKKDIDVKLHNQNILSVSGTKKELTKEEKESMIKQERFSGSFSRSFTLPEDINPDSIKVTHKNGILKVIVQKDRKKIKEKVKNLIIE